MFGGNEMTERDPLISKSQAIEALESAWESARSKGRLWSMNELHRAKEILAALPAIPPPRDADENYALMYRIQTLEIENEKLRAALPAIPLDDKLERIMAFAANVRDAEQVSREFLVDGIAAILAGYDDAIPGAPVEPVPAPELLALRKFSDDIGAWLVHSCEDLCPMCGRDPNSHDADCWVQLTLNAWDELIDGPKSAPVPAPRLEAKFIPGEEVIYFGRRVLVDAVTFGHGFPVLYEIVDPADENQRHYDVAEHLLSPPVGTQE
jgi:hypothetical protein